ncbi:MAG: hypothetical protein JSS97_00800 [Actinobacteria bacterium]|nr:hypothetical protein [Actinomycetota bacterium]
MGQTTLDRDDRDALVDLMVYRYFVGADLRIMRDRERGVADELVATWFKDDMALMTDLGWLGRWCLGVLGLPGDEKTEFEISLPPERLRPALERALADAREASAAGSSPLDGSPEGLFDRAAQACEALLAEIDRTEA